MSTSQNAALDTMLREADIFGGDTLHEQRQHFEHLQTSMPTPSDVRTSHSSLAGVPAITIDVDGFESNNVIVYFHGGGYCLGSALASVNLASAVGRNAHSRIVTVDYRLAPEHPGPAAVDDALAAYRALLDGGLRPANIAIAGESAGGGIAIAVLVAIKEAALPPPAAAAVFSPWVDLSLSGASTVTHKSLDPVLTRDTALAGAANYGGSTLEDPRISPLFADLSGLPPLLIQVGTHEILLDDAVRLAGRAAAAHVSVTLEVTAGVPHVFQAFAAILDEGADSLHSAGRFLRAHLE
jgi:monoterpene epsilon-lactone hydrolase